MKIKKYNNGWLIDFPKLHCHTYSKTFLGLIVSAIDLLVLYYRE